MKQVPQSEQTKINNKQWHKMEIRGSYYPLECKKKLMKPMYEEFQEYVTVQQSNPTYVDTETSNNIQQ